MEDPDFAKQNDRDSAARPLTDIPTKLLKQGLDVPPRQAAAYGTREDQLKGALVLPLHPSTVLPIGTKRRFRLTACHIRITLPLSGGQAAWGGVAESWWWPVHSRGLLEGVLVLRIAQVHQ
jgi:hypothetical protein